VDATKLAKLLFLDEVPPVYVPSADVRAWRGMIEFRAKIVGERTRVKNRIRALLRTLGVVAPRGLWTKRGMAWLREQGLGSESDQVRRDVLIDELESIGVKIKRVEKVLEAVAEEHPGVHLLKTIPGVGPRTAEAVVAYIDKPERFGSNKTVGSYFGLVPSQDASAGQNRLGRITRQGPGTVRRLLIEAAWQGLWRSERIRGFFQHVQGGDPERRKIAIVATAHYMLRAMHAMLLRGECWRSTAFRDAPASMPQEPPARQVTGATR
jgi:transposase